MAEPIFSFDPHKKPWHNPHRQLPLDDIDGILPPTEQRRAIKHSINSFLRDERRARKEAKELFWELADNITDEVLGNNLDGYYQHPLAEEPFEGYVNIEQVAFADGSGGYLCTEFQGRPEDDKYVVDRWTTALSETGNFGIVLTSTEGQYPADPNAVTQIAYLMGISEGSYKDIDHAVFRLNANRDVAGYAPDWCVGLDARAFIEREVVRDHLAGTAITLASLDVGMAIGHEDAEFVRRYNLFVP